METLSDLEPSRPIYLIHENDARHYAHMLSILKKSEFASNRFYDIDFRENATAGDYTAHLDLVFERELVISEIVSREGSCTNLRPIARIKLTELSQENP